MSDQPAAPEKKKRALPNVIKIVLAVLVGLAMLAAMGTVWVKDGRKNPGYCTLCHEEPYYEGWAEEDSVMLAHSHAQMGISCQTCHGRTVSESLEEWKDYVVGYEVPLRERKLPMETCFTCHGSYEEIIPLTDPEVLGSERNPHDGHWGQLECNVCHNMHRESIDYCAGCHNPVTDEVGWVSPTEGS
jgi:hypothetical protein